MNNNPRSTHCISSPKDESNAIRIVEEFRNLESPTLHYVLSKFLECSILKNEPAFIEIIFYEHIQLVLEMFEWMLTPKFIAKKKNIKSNLDFYPSRVKELIKDNICFYEQLYVSIRNAKFPISICFNFLRPEFFDKETIYTALGYFADVMIPFAKYEFSGSQNIAEFEFSSETEIDGNETLSIMKILPKSLIDELIDYAHYEPIFQFIKTAVLVSIEDTEEYEISKFTISKLLVKSQVPHIFSNFSTFPEVNSQLGKQIDLLENITISLKEILANIEPGSDMQLRTESFISVILESKIIPYAATQIMESSFCNPVYPRAYSTIFSSGSITSNEEAQSPKLISARSTLSLNQGAMQNKNVNFFENSEEDLMEVLLKLLTFSTEVFIKIPKVVSTFVDCQERLSSLNSTRSASQESYKYLLNNFHEQIQFLLDKLEVISKLAYSEYDNYDPIRSIPFSSGQKIKPVSFMKYEFLRLIHNCLILLQCSENTDNKVEKVKANDKPVITINSKIKKTETITFPPFKINLEKLHIIEVVQKYLSENKWNNLTHHTIEKICHLLISSRYDYMSKKIEKDKNKKITEGFLAFLIENFTQRQHIFLDTLKFTNQGNLQSIYTISKDLAYTMNNTNQLIIYLNDFEPWKKFLMNDLKVYEENTYAKTTQPKETQELQSPNKEIVIKIDEVDTIRKLIENISATKKWPTRISKHKGTSKSGIIRNKDDQNSDENSPMARSHGFHLRPRYNSSQVRSDQSPKKTLNDLMTQSIGVSYGSEIRHLDIDDESITEAFLMEGKSKSEIIERKDKYNEAYVFKSHADSNLEKKSKS